MQKPSWLILLLAMSTAVCAESDDFWVLTNLEPPFSQADERGKLSGYAIELVENILTTAGVKQTILAAPWERVLKEGRDKANVLVFAVARTAEREQDFHWITPITANVYGIYALRGRHKSINKFEALADFGPIAVLQNDFRQDIMAQHAYIKIAPYGTWADAIQALLNGQAQGLFFSDGGVEYFCKRNTLDCNDVQRVYTYQTVTTYLVMSKVNSKAGLVDKLSSAAVSYKQSDDFQRLTKSWLARYRKSAEISMHQANGVINLWSKE
jgi:polar amino acid transport system substrate-binding protein